MDKNNVTIESIQDALDYLDKIDEVKKSNSHGKVDEDTNGGKKEPVSLADIEKCVKSLTESFADLKKSVENKFDELEKAKEEKEKKEEGDEDEDESLTAPLKKGKKVKKSEESEEEPEKDDDDDSDNDEGDDNEELDEPIKKSSAHKLETLLKSLVEKVEILESSNEELKESLNQPVRRSARNVSALRKSFSPEIEELEEEAPRKALRKSDISKELFDAYAETEFKDEVLEKAIVTYEATSQLSPIARETLSKRGIKL
jgi:hypothetical protein